MDPLWRRTGWRATACWLVLAVAVLVGGLFGLNEVRNVAVSFDGGMTAQTAMSLVDEGRYATRYRELTDFDHRVTTGPTVVLPVALCYGVLGAGNTVYQIPSLLYFIALFGLTAGAACRYAGPAAGLITVLLLLQTPRLLDLGLRLYGEVPAVVFLLGGVLLLDRVWRGASGVWPWLAGLCLGLSILTKLMMVIPVAGVLCVLLWARINGDGLSWRRVGAVVGGCAAPHLVFESIKLVVLSPPVFVTWWEQLIRRSIAHGTSYQMPNTIHGISKPYKHLHLLAQKLHEPWWVVTLFVAVPLVLLLIMAIVESRETKRSVLVSVVTLEAAAVFQLGWWLILSPTRNSWLRRALGGVLIQELVAAVVLVWGAVWLWNRARRRISSAWWSPIVVGGLTVTLAWGLAAFFRYSPAGLRPESRPTEERVVTEAFAARVRALSGDAVLYAVGWYEAPVISALTGRRIRDFEQFPPHRYRTQLVETYLVVDSHLWGNRPEVVESILDRSRAELIWERWRCRLYRLDEVLPFAPIADPEDVAELREMYRPSAHPDYRFYGGLGADPSQRHLSRSVSGVRLRRDGLECLWVSLTPRFKAGRRPRLEIRIDETLILEARLRGGRQWERVIPVVDPPPAGAQSVVVELWLWRDGAERRFALVRDDLETFSLEGVGFADCGEPRASSSRGSTIGAGQ